MHEVKILGLTSETTFIFQKQTPEVLCKNSFSEKFSKFHRKTPVLESLFNKVAVLKTYNFIKKMLQHRCFLVKFAKF